jgi:hypothetical protein
VTVSAAGFGVGGALLGLEIAAPWGAHTIVYVFAGLTVVAILCVLVGALGQAVHDLYRTRPRRPR